MNMKKLIVAGVFLLVAHEAKSDNAVSFTLTGVEAFRFIHNLPDCRQVLRSNQEIGAILRLGGRLQHIQVEEGLVSASGAINTAKQFVINASFLFADGTATEVRFGCFSREGRMGFGDPRYDY